MLKIKDIIEKDKDSNERSYASEQGILYGRIGTKKIMGATTLNSQEHDYIAKNQKKAPRQHTISGTKTSLSYIESFNQ